MKVNGLVSVWEDGKIATLMGIIMRDCTAICNKAGDHVATIGFNEGFGLWQILVVNREETEFFCPSKEIAFAAWRHEFDPETWSPKSSSPGGFDA